MKKEVRYFILIFLGFLIILTISLEVTYSFMKSQVKEEENISDINVNSCAKIIFEENSKEINLTNTYPMSDEVGLQTEPFIFSISTSCNLDINYKIYISSLKTMDSLENKVIRYAIKDINNNKLLVIKDLKDAVAGEIDFASYELDMLKDENIYRIYQNNLTSSEIQKLALYVWIKDDVASTTTMNQDLFLKVSVKAFEKKDNYAILGTENSLYKEALYKNKIKNIYFVDSLNNQNDSIKTWDLSKNKDNSIIGWLVSNMDNYDLYIGSNYPIQIADFSYAFANMVNLENIDFALIDTKDLNNMQYMFKGDTNLKEIDISNFDTRNVTNMEGVFADCENLEKIIGIEDLSTLNVTNMAYLFSNLPKITELDLSNWQTNKVNNMNYMFYNAIALKTLNFKNASFNENIKVADIFTNVFPEINIIVKDELSQKFIENIIENNGSVIIN